MPKDSAAPPRRAYWIFGVVGSIALVVALYAVWAAYLAVMADEGALPPRSRMPDVPAEARVVSETKQCASGGCRRELLLRPAAGQSPAELAEEMGVAEEQRSSWHLLDPHSVVVGSSVAGDELRVHVRY